MYGITIKFYEISSVIHGEFMACFSIVPMKKQAVNFQKIVQFCCQVVIDTKTFHGDDHTNTENGSKILKFEVPCTENYKLRLEAV